MLLIGVSLRRTARDEPSPTLGTGEPVARRPEAPSASSSGRTPGRPEDDDATVPAPYPDAVTASRAQRLQDLVLAVVLAALGLLEIWLPMDSVAGQGSRTTASVGVLATAALISQRRTRPPLLLGVPLVLPVLALVGGGHLLVLFLGQLVPLATGLYSVARHGRGRLPWVGAAVYGGVLVLADLTIPELQGGSEVVFHWGVMTLAFVIGRGLNVSEDRAVRAAVRAAAVEAAAREQTLTALAEERARIARELHDIVAHTMSGMVVQAGAAAQVVDEDPDFVRRALETIRRGGSEALGEMRRMVSMLRADDGPAGLVPQPGLGSLDELLSHTRDHGVDVELVHEGDGAPLPAGVDLAAYRIVQESLTNVRKHSCAPRARVVVRRDDRGLLVEVSDDGPPAPAGGPPGHGLAGIRERAALYGGHVEAGPSPTGGFRVRATLPLAGAG